MQFDFKVKLSYQEGYDTCMGIHVHVVHWFLWDSTLVASATGIRSILFAVFPSFSPSQGGALFIFERARFSVLSNVCLQAY